MTHDPEREIQTGATDRDDHPSAIPLALMTVGWDAGGSPLYVGGYSDCSTALLHLPQVLKWFISHEGHSYARPPKVSSKK